jgi:hypothetical protein
VAKEEAMMWRTGAVACALALALAGGAGAQTSIAVQDERGTVARIDPQGNVIVLEDGRMFRITPGTTVFVNDQPAARAALSPGVPVVIRSGELEVRFSPDVARTVREGDTVQLDVTVTPRGALPSASPVLR